MLRKFRIKKLNRLKNWMKKLELTKNRKKMLGKLEHQLTNI